jgi:amino acid adenylation domain-containing protein
VSTQEFILQLRQLGVELRAEGERLHCAAPSGLLQGELLNQLQQRKPEILEHLRLAQRALAPSEALQPAPDTGPVRASSAQQRLWLLEQIEANSPYNCFITLQFEGNLQVAVLERSLQELVNRHQSLRTNLEPREGGLWQIIRPESHWLLQRKSLPGPQSMAKLTEALREEIRIQFDLSQGPVFRALLLTLDPQTHVLHLTMHHCFCDGWSVGNLFEELTQLYKAYMTGMQSPLPPLPLQYSDWVLWQSRRLQGDFLAQLRQFWKSRLSGAPPLLELPADLPRPAQQSFAGDRRHRCLPGPLMKGLEALGHEHGASLFMTLLAAFYVLLNRYSGQADLVVGSPVANRSQLASEKLLGCFMNLLALRQKVTSNQTFLELLEAVKEMCLEAYHHQEFPFDALVEEINPERSTAHSPLFQVLFAVQNFPIRDIHIPGLVTKYLDFNSQMSKLDLSLYIYDFNLKVWVEGADPDLLGAQDGKVACLEFATDLFEGATAERWLRNYERLLEAILAHPEQPVSELSLVLNQLGSVHSGPAKQMSQNGEPGAQQQAAAEGDNCVQPVEGQSQPLLPERFELQARLRPGAVALVDPQGRSWSYRQLNERANQLAHYLISRGVGPGRVVGVCLPRSLDLLVALLAVLKAGAAYLPLGMDYPEARLGQMCAAASGVLTRRGLLPEQLGVAWQAFTEELELADFPQQNPDRRPHPHDLAYLIFTSGSTGVPKGVEVEHCSLSYFLECMANQPGLSEDDVLVAVTPITFDIAALELFLPLTVGARVVLAGPEVALDGYQLKQLLDSSRATVLQATPVTWRLLLQSGWQGSPQLRAFCGGEGYGRDLADQILQRTQELWNMYGPTEATIWCSVSRVKPGAVPLGLGAPLPQSQFYVLDPELRAVPFGARGELYIGGPCLARGYWNQPDLTTQRFLPNPFDQGQTRLYRSGDLVRYRNDGSLEFLGRNDHQIKLRGFRIELGEIETALSQHPEVLECAVQPQDEMLCAFVVFRGQPPPEAELTGFLESHLPPYMVPRIFVNLARLPVSPNGKLDRRALPMVEQRQRHPSSPYLAPQKHLEKVIAAVWKEVLKLEKVSLTDNFFDLGGHSLLLVQAYAQLNRQIDRDFPLVDLFAYPNVASLAAHLEGLESPASSTPSRQLQTLAQRRRQLQGQ